MRGASKQAEADLRQAQVRLENAVEAKAYKRVLTLSDDSLMLLDVLENILDAKPTLRELYGVLKS